MVKKIISTGISSIVLLGLASPALAQFGLQQSADKAQYGDRDIYSMITTVISVGLSMLGIVFLALMFYSGLRWMTARGNEELANKGKDAMINATYGFVLVVLAYALTRFIFSKFAN